MCSDIAIKVENLSKCYQIYDTPRDRLKQFVFPKLRRSFRLQTRNYFREFWALKDVSFEVKRGETIGIVGRNGSGKSTLLQIICGTLNPNSGTIKTTGRIAALLELGSGFNPEFTGRENVYLNSAVLGLSGSEINNRYDAILAFAGIGDFIDQPVKTYSSGMIVRLAFAVIANVDADILVIDEALAVGDAFFTQKCMRFLREFKKRGTILFVSHDTNAVVNLCNKAILLEHGMFKAQGTPKDITTQYLQELYEEKQGKNGTTIADTTGTTEDEDSIEFQKNEFRDMRLDFFNTTNLRNDIEILMFNSAAQSFGKGGALIETVMLTDHEDKPLSWVVGGEMVKLKIYIRSNSDFSSPIVGFQLKDRLGQIVFGDVTYFTDQCKNFNVCCGQKLVATFEFRFPVMRSGDYSISPAIAEGTLDEHIQHHWIHDALILKVHASSICFGLVGIPMKRITLNVHSPCQSRNGDS